MSVASSPFYGEVANSTSPVELLNKPFNMSDVTSVVTSTSPECAITSVSLWQDKDATKPWMANDVVSWDPKTKTGTFSMKAVFDTQYISVKVTNAGGFSVVISFPVTVTPANLYGNCGPQDVQVDLTRLEEKHPSGVIEINEFVDTTVGEKVFTMDDLRPFLKFTNTEAVCADVKEGKLFSDLTNLTPFTNDNIARIGENSTLIVSLK